MTRPEAYIAATGTAAPPLITTEHFVKVCKADYEKEGKDEEMIKFERLCTASRIHTRSLSLAKFHQGTDTADLVYLGKRIGAASPNEVQGATALTAEQRHALWEEIAPKLALEAAGAAMSKWSGSPADITHVVTTNTSGWSERPT